MSHSDTPDGELTGAGAPRPRPRHAAPSPVAPPTPQAGTDPPAPSPEGSQASVDVPEPPATQAPDSKSPRRGRRRTRMHGAEQTPTPAPVRVARLRRVLLAAAIVFVLAGVAAVVTYFVRDDSGSTATASGGAGLDDPDLAEAFIGGATSDLAAVTSYDYRDLDAALASGSAVTTGAYRTSYRNALTGSLGALARKNRIIQTFTVQRLGIGEIDDDGTQAKVLAFGRRTVTQQSGSAKQRSSQTQSVTITATVQRNGNQFLISGLDQDTNAGLPPGNDQLTAAAEAAREEILNLLTYSRDSYATDSQRALDGATGSVRTQIKKRSATNLREMKAGKYDRKGSVTALGVQSVSPDAVALLVAATGRRIPDSGTAKVTSNGQYQITMTLVDGRWLASAITTVGS